MLPAPVPARSCRWCDGSDVAVVLDLGHQPPADYFPLASDPRTDPMWPLRMGLCARCGLAQLLEDPGTVEEPLGMEPQALVDQAGEAVEAITAAGLSAAGVTFAEFDSPHGGSWRPVLGAAGCVDRTGSGEQCDLVVDVFGLMHDGDQAAALERRVDALAPEGTLLLQFHSLESILRQQQWNALRHGHMAYYSTSALVGMLAARGLTAARAWTFDLYGGTVLLAASRLPTGQPADPTLERLLTLDRTLGATTVEAVGALALAADQNARELAGWLAGQRADGQQVIGYGAASRAVPLLVRAGVGSDLLAAIADGSPAKTGRCVPSTRIPIVAADELTRRDDDIVLLFVPDLLDEVRRHYPQVEARGGRWALSEPRPHLVPPLR